MTLTTDPYLDAVTLFLVVATGILAYKTWQLHAATVALAIDTVNATKMSDTHHQETLSPICVIGATRAAYDGQHADLQVLVRNVGSGPGLDIALSAAPVSGATVYSSEEKCLSCTPLSQNSESGWLDFGRFKAPGHTVQLRVTFKNAFGQQGFSDWRVSVPSGELELLGLQLCKALLRI